MLYVLNDYDTHIARLTVTRAMANLPNTRI